MRVYLKEYCFGMLLMIIFHFSAFAQQNKKLKNYDARKDTTSTEYWRKKGFESKKQGTPQLAIAFYKKVLIIDSTDYDAKLALANLYFTSLNYEQALTYYEKIYKTDYKDVEALHGIGKCYLELGNLTSSINYLKKAISYLPTYITPQLDLAKAYKNNGELKKALKIYLDILEKDDTHIEALSGAAQILYWQDKPASAAYYIKRALAINPSQKIKLQYEEIINTLKYEVYLRFTNMDEFEDGVTTKTKILKAGLNKRLGNYFNITLNTGIESSKKIVELHDTARKFDNTVIKISYMNAGQVISAFAGVSASDSRLTAYGGSYTSSFAVAKVKVKNTLVGSYDYFYYWQKVDRNVYGDNLSIGYRRLLLEGDYRRGEVRYNYIWDYETKDKNPFESYMIGIKYKFLKNPMITVGMMHNYVNFAAHSPLYYSPYERSMNGFSINPYYQYKKFYTYISYSYRVDNYKNNLWTGEGELGYSLKNLSFAAGGSVYRDPYYKNNIVYISIKDRF
jgi:tetratricopeptide (TPR) repeat protein